MIKKHLFIFIFLFPFLFSAQKPRAKFVFEKGKFLFDKTTYKKYKQTVAKRKKYFKKIDSINKIRAKKNLFQIPIFDCNQPSLPELDSSLGAVRIKMLKHLDIKNRKFGKNSFSVLIDKKGKVKKIKASKITDRKIYKQVKKLLLSKDFSHWTPANFYGDVDFLLRFSIIIDNNFSKYNTKHITTRFWEDNNLSEFQKK